MENTFESMLRTSKKITEEVAKIRQERIKKFSEIVKGVSYKYQSAYLEREDLEQELWITVLNIVRSCGGEENTDPRLIAKSCFNRAVDLYRHSLRHNQDYPMDNESLKDVLDFRSSMNFSHAKFRTGYDEAIMRDIIDLFERGSKERKYLIAKLYMYGDVDEHTPGLRDEIKEIEDLDFDKEIDVLHYIGYTGRTASGSWMKCKYAMKSIIESYFKEEPNNPNEKVVKVKITIEE